MSSELPVLGIVPLGFPWETRDPFLACMHHKDAYPAGNDEFGPNASLAGRTIGQDFAGIDGWRMYHGERVPGFPQHPHRGFETVTVVRRGLLDHADSLGAAARYGNGDVQWLTTGAGILHSEMFPLLEKDAPNPFEFFQIWLNLPRARKMATPHFAMLWNDAIPNLTLSPEGAPRADVTLVAGSINDAVAPPPPPNSWAAQPDANVAIWTIQLEPHAQLTLPPAASSETNRTLYFFEGSGLRVAGTTIADYHRIEVRADQPIELQAGDVPAQLLLLQGRPIGEPVVQYGPFVMNSREEIRKTFIDYQRTQFGGWPWDRSDPIHAREERFARRPDGTIERPA